MRHFEINVRKIEHGWCHLQMDLNGKTITFSASCMGNEPL